MHTWFTAPDVMNPAVHFAVSGAGANAWFGWPNIPQLETLTVDWVRATEARSSSKAGSSRRPWSVLVGGLHHRYTRQAT